jgi:hypothetical protein
VFKHAARRADLLVNQAQPPQHSRRPGASPWLWLPSVAVAVKQFLRTPLVSEVALPLAQIRARPSLQPSDSNYLILSAGAGNDDGPDDPAACGEDLRRQQDSRQVQCAAPAFPPPLYCW